MRYFPENLDGISTIVDTAVRGALKGDAQELGDRMESLFLTLPKPKLLGCKNSEVHVMAVERIG